jgi:hypothetical protein
MDGYSFPEKLKLPPWYVLVWYRILRGLGWQPRIDGIFHDGCFLPGRPPFAQQGGIHRGDSCRKCPRRYLDIISRNNRAIFSGVSKPISSTNASSSCASRAKSGYVDSYHATWIENVDIRIPKLTTAEEPKVAVFRYRSRFLYLIVPPVCCTTDRNYRGVSHHTGVSIGPLTLGVSITDAV